MKSEFTYKRMDRRAALKWMLGATATIHLLNKTASAQALETSSKGYGTDPNLLAGEVPWERTMTPEQLRTTAKLADIILPRTSDSSPSATEVQVPDFIDEWISAPYEAQQNDRTVIVDGLEWIDREARRRFDRNSHELEEPQWKAICDDICFLPDSLPEYEYGARFFEKFRNLTLGGYYTTDIGMKDVGYVGNVALPSFDGPPPEVLTSDSVSRKPPGKLRDKNRF